MTLTASYGAAPSPTPRAFLDRFPDNKRSAVGQLFHTAALAGVEDAESLVIRVAARTGELLGGRPTLDDDRALLLQLRDALETDRGRALNYAQDVITRAQLPADERRRQKEVRQAQYRDEWLRKQPPTDAQLAYLKALGCDRTPANHLEASGWINELKAKKGGLA